MTGSSGTLFREPQTVARLSRTFSQSLSAVDLAEPLLSLDETQPASAALALMRERNLHILGVRCAGLVSGWVTDGELGAAALGDCAHVFARDEVLEENASLAAVLGALAAREQVFVAWLGEVAGVITRRDLQKPPLRMWLFGAITVLDTNLTWAITELFPRDTWQSRLTPGRLEKALALRAERERRGSECRLVDCLQVKDKADLLLSEEGNLALIGFSSRREAERLTRDIEKLRNHLAHAQELEPGHLATAARLAVSIELIIGAEGARRVVAARGKGAPAAGES